MQVAYPGQAYLDPTHRILLATACSPTDELSTTLAHSGMSRHFGDEAQPSVALLDRHIRALDTDLQWCYEATEDRMLRLKIA